MFCRYLHVRLTREGCLIAVASVTEYMPPYAVATLIANPFSKLPVVAHVKSYAILRANSESGAHLSPLRLQFQLAP